MARPGAMSAAAREGQGRREVLVARREAKRATRAEAATRPLEQRMLLTATMCLLAFGALMVYSASSARDLLATGGDGTGYLVRYLGAAAIGLIVMNLLQRRGLEAVDRLTKPLLIVSLLLLVAVMAPGIGVEVNGARRWVGASAIQLQPSELAKLALVFYGAGLLSRPGRDLRSLRSGGGPLILAAGLACLLVAAEPDLGTALVIAFTVGSLLIASGVPLRKLGMLLLLGFVLVAVFAVIAPYRRARLTAFLDPWAHAGSTGFQSVQGQIALGSGGLFGVGIGQSVQKIFYLPEAHTDFILAVIGEELGVMGVFAVLSLYGMIAYAGLRTARAAIGARAQLLATGITALILCQGTLNVFTVLGLAPLTGVPLPFISYGPSNLIVMLAGMGVLLNIASGAKATLRAVPDHDNGFTEADAYADRHSRGRDRWARSAGAGRR